jgi:hypothetical protein
MRYINKREKFLIKYKTNEELDMSMSGPMGNDIPWGDSLVGRLINSTIRVAKIKYDTTKVDTLLRDFKSQLDLILAESLSRDTRSEFLKLLIKGMLNDIDRICTSSDDENGKLIDLLGTDIGNDLWDPNYPNRGEFTENVTSGILLNIHNKIELDIHEKHIEIAGVKKDDLLSDLGEFIDDLREYAWSLYNAGAPSSQTKRSSKFPIKLWGLMRRNYTSTKQNASHNLRLKGYLDFIKESNDNNKKELITNIIENLKSMYILYTSKIKKDIEKDKVSNQKNTESMLLSLFSEIEEYTSGDINLTKLNTDKLHQDIINIHTGKNQNLNYKFSKTIYFLYKNGNVDDIQQIEHIKKLFGELKSNMDSLLTLLDKQSSEEVSIDAKLDIGEETKKTIEELVKIEKEDEKKINDVVQKIGKNDIEKILQDIIKKTKSDEDKKEAKELLSQLEPKNESLFIKESISSNDTSINVLWRKWLKDTGVPAQLISISQREIDKLEQMIRGERSEQNLMFSPKKTPDPIINIIRIFKRVHDLYYTDIIPSGRSGGKVSNKTLRQYEKLGKTSSTSSSFDPKAPGFGPWAVKSIRNKWVDGVMKIIEDQEYRKIFANTKFVVGGSEDTFNVESINYNKYSGKILENEGKKESHGKILFDFITDMLSKETAADFDQQRDILLKKYFGSSVVVKEENLSSVKNVNSPEKPSEAVDDKSLYWTTIANKDVDITNIPSSGGPVIMFPYKIGSNEDIIKFIVLDERTLHDSDNKPHIMYVIRIFKNVKDTDFYSRDYSEFKITNDDYPGKYYQNREYALLIKAPIDKKNIDSSKKFKIVFWDTSQATPRIFTHSTNQTEFDIEVINKSADGNVVPSVLMGRESGKDKQVKVIGGVHNDISVAFTTHVSGITIP